MNEQLQTVLTNGLIVLFLAFLYASGIAWVYRDTSRRGLSQWHQGVMVALSLIPLVGFLVYLLLRLSTFSPGVRLPGLLSKTRGQRSPSPRGRQTDISPGQTSRSTTLRPANGEATPASPGRPTQLPRRNQLRLRAVDGPGRISGANLLQKQNVIGRQADANAHSIVVDGDDAISRRHAVLEFPLSDGFRLQNLSQRSETWAQGHLLALEEIVELPLSVEFRLGDTTFVIEGQRPASMTPVEDRHTSEAPYSYPTAPICTLLVTEGPHRGQRFLIKQFPAKIGRSAHCEILLEQDAQVSREHATIAQSGNDIRIRSISKYGVVVNGYQASDKSLHLGDAIRIGQSLLVVESLQ